MISEIALKQLSGLESNWTTNESNKILRGGIVKYEIMSGNTKLIFNTDNVVSAAEQEAMLEQLGHRCYKALIKAKCEEE